MVQEAGQTPPATTATATDGAIPATATEPLGDVDRRWLEGFREATDPMDEQLAPIGSGVSPVEAAAAAVIVLGVCETTKIGIAPSAATQAIEERWTAGCDAIGNGYDLIADGVNTGDQSKVDDGIATFNQGVETAGSALARADELLGRSEAGEAKAPDEGATPEAEPTQAAPVADGRFSSTCDYVLGDFTESSRGFRFVANANLKNTGEIGIVVRLAAQWKQGGKGPIKVVKIVKVPVGRTQNVGITRIATGDEIDLHQATDQGCTVKASIIDTLAADDESPIPDAGTSRRVRLNPVPLFVPGSSGRCFTRNTNPDASITVAGRTYIAGVIQCGGHEPPEQRASGSYGLHPTHVDTGERTNRRVRRPKPS